MSTAFSFWSLTENYGLSVHYVGSDLCILFSLPTSQQISTTSFTLKESFQYTKKTKPNLNNKYLNSLILKTEDE